MLMPKVLLFLLSYAVPLFVFTVHVDGASRKVKDKDNDGEELLLLKRVSYFYCSFSQFDICRLICKVVSS